MREKFADRRGSTTIKMRYADTEGLVLHGYVTYSRDSAGAIKEVFVNSGKPGSPTEAAMRDAGLLLSLLLQHGVPLAEIKATLTRAPQDQPASQIGVVVDALVAEGQPPTLVATTDLPRSLGLVEGPVV